MPGRAESEREAVEIALLLEGVYQHYGFDFRHYAKASLRRRDARAYCRKSNP